MNEKFFDLPAERQDQMLNGAMLLFASHGYKKASMDEIAAAAGVSKGLVYHYFGSKKELYLFLFHRGVEVVMKALTEDLDRSERDIFRIMSRAVEVKLTLLGRHPALFDFLMSAYNESSVELQNEMARDIAALRDSGIDTMFANIDANRFLPGIDLARIIELMSWISEGFMKKHPDIGNESPVAVHAQFQVYMEILKRAFYKEEYLA